MATVSKWTPFGVALDLTATGGSITRKSATQFTVKINASWETYYSGAKTNYGMTALSGGGSVNLNKFGTKSSSGSGSFTGTYSISGNGSATKTITVTFKNYEEDWQGNVTKSASKTVSFNVTVPAWTSYTVKYNANGGSGAPSNQTKWKDQKLTLSTTKPTRTGYTFKGWSTSSSGSVVYNARGSYTANASVTLYAVWQAITYTVQYNANGGSGAPSNQTKTYGKTLVLSSTKPTRAGYTFKGWATSASGSVAYASGANYTSNSAIVLYAVWQINTYTIKYNANGGTGAPSNQTKTHGVSLSLSNVQPLRDSYIDENGDTVNYTFKGWSTSSSSTAVAYKSGATYTSNASATLYAVWSTTTTINTYDIVYETGDGTKVSSQVKSREIDIILSSTIPQKNGFSFVNWNTNSDGSGTSYNSGDAYSIDEDLILYAIWKPWTHAVNFDVNGGVGDTPSSFEKTGGIDQIISEITPVKSGYILTSWNTKSDGSGVDYYSNEVYDVEQDGGEITLYAIWETTDIFIYPNGEWKSREFIEMEKNDSYNLSFVNDGSVRYVEFIEGNEIRLNSNALYVSELIERTTVQLTDELGFDLTDELENYLTTLI